MFEKYEKKQKRIEYRLNRYFRKGKPFGEWRFPLMVLTMSSFIFILITAAFGVRFNSLTGQPEFEMDWSKYIDPDTKAYDPWVYDPMAQYIQNNRYMIFVTFLGMYYGGICIFTIYWFKYQKWKWLNIPIEERYEEKVVKLKTPNNSLYRVEMMERRK